MKQRRSLARLKLPVPEFKDADVPNYEKRDPAPKFQLPLSPAESQKLIQVPVDFELTTVCIRARYRQTYRDGVGRKGHGLWVIETEDYPNEIRPKMVPAGTGSRSAKTPNGDGKADKFTVFADKLNIPTSITFANGA
jgi:hypothetical protein